MVSGRTSSMSDTRIIMGGEELAYEFGAVLMSREDKILYVFLVVFIPCLRCMNSVWGEWGGFQTGGVNGEANI